MGELMGVERKRGEIFWCAGERWLHVEEGNVIPMADLAPNLEREWCQRNPSKRREAELGWRRVLKGAEGGRD